MKKLYTLIILFFASAAAFGQCTPDPSLAGAPAGFYPPSGSSVNGATITLPAVNLGQSVNQQLDLIILTDTTLSFFGLTFTVPIDSFIITDVSGLPPGLSYVCDNSNCGWQGGQHGCFSLQGTPTQAGNYQFLVDALFTVSIPGVVDTSAQAVFTFIMDVINPASVFEARPVEFNLMPNPASSYVDIRNNRQN
jgi:hypothetical protein